VGGPKWDSLPPDERPERGALLPLRKHFSLFANLRPGICLPELVDASPVKNSLIPGGFDILCVRELTGGMYFGEPKFYGERNGETIGLDTLIYKKSEVERIARVAFEAARGRSKKLCSVDKANVLATSRLWRETAKAMEKDYPEVEVEYMFVDNAAMKIIQQPRHFDVVVTENMFGDILTDEASVITGSLGLLPSASIGTGTSLFEPIHGSYPQAAGKNIANPIATILSAAMMFEYAFSDMEAGAAIRRAVDLSIEQNVVTEDIAPEGIKPSTTTEVGDFIAKNI
jgi:3-isopropylmalate dehydrogenase